MDVFFGCNRFDDFVFKSWVKRTASVNDGAVFGDLFNVDDDVGRICVLCADNARKRFVTLRNKKGFCYGLADKHVAHRYIMK